MENQKDITESNETGVPKFMHRNEIWIKNAGAKSHG